MKSKIHRLAGISLLAGFVVVLQMLGQFIRIGPVSITLVLVPIVVGSSLYGPGAGAILGAAFGAVVLLQPDAMLFYGVSILGTVLTVMAKGIAAGWIAGRIFLALKKRSELLAVTLAAIVCPVVNTAIFSLGCRVFFWDLLLQLGGGRALLYLVTVMIGFNFLAELAANLVCAPVILRILRISPKI